MKKLKQKAVKKVATIRLYDYVQSELIKKGLNEYVDANGNLIFFNDESQFMTKIFSYDEDISSIVNSLFNQMGLNASDHDEHFKKTFFYHFLNRRIGRQTIEAFKWQLLATFMMNKDYINRMYSDIELYLNQVTINEQNNSSSGTDRNEQNSETTNTQTSQNTNTQTNNQTDTQKTDGTNTTDNREAEAKLPQSQAQLDVNSTLMTTADNNRISRNKNLTNQESNSVSEGETVGNNTGLSDSKNTGINKAESSSTSESNALGENKSYRLDELFKTKGLHEQILKVFDKKCFSQVW